MSKSTIEWTERTWNPIVSGCSIISQGCKNCYAMEMARRLEFMGQEKYAGLTEKTEGGHIRWNGKIKIDMDDKALYKPLKRKKPTMYFVNSMTDLFHDDVPFEAIDRVMAVIALCPQHTFQVLTKRPERMKEYFTNKNWDLDWVLEKQGYEKPFAYEISDERLTELSDLNYILPNLWLGVSVENQKTANERIPFLLETPAKVRFLSCEPLLENIEFINKIGLKCDICGNDDGEVGRCFCGMPTLSGIHWVIVGGESGKGARPMHPDWVRNIKEQCENADVAFFFKQWGEYCPVEKHKNGAKYLANGVSYNISIFKKTKRHFFDEYVFSLKVGKKIAGRLLDGIEYNEMPK